MALKLGIVVAAIAVLWGFVHKTLVHRSIQQSPGSSTASGPSPVRSEATTGTREAFVSVTAEVSPSLWKSIESRDPQKLIANLRDIGCPEQTIRDLMTFRVCRQYRKKLLELEIGYLVPLGYTKSLAARDQQHRTAREHELREEMDAELESLFGTSAAEIKGSLLGRSVLGGTRSDQDFLPLEKRRRLREVSEHYRLLTQEAREGLTSLDSDPEIESRVEELDQRRESEIAGALTPSEYEEYRLRTSPAASYVRANLPQAGSENEFRQMVRVVEEVGIPAPRTQGNRYSLPFLSRLNLNTNVSDEQELVSKQAQLEARLQEVLGAERYAEMKQNEQNRSQ